MSNIEPLISRISYELVSEKILEETEINKLLGVLSNNGVYAMWVYALDKIGVKFYEDTNQLENERIFRLLSKISELDKFITKNFKFEELVNDLANLTKEIKELKEYINKLKQDINKIEKELKNLTGQEKKQKENKLESKKHELKIKRDELEQKEKERIEKLNEYFINISEDIHKLLFLKQLLEKTLIYARYHAKALGD